MTIIDNSYIYSYVHTQQIVIHITLITTASKTTNDRFYTSLKFIKKIGNIFIKKTAVINT